MPCLCEFYPGTCFTTEEKARKNLSQGTVYILPKHAHIAKPTHTHTHTLKKPTHTHTNTLQNPHITKQYKTTTVQIKTNTVQDIPK